MKKGIHPLVIGNWKMNPVSGTLAVKLAKQLKSSLAKVDGVEVVIAPPFVYLESVEKICNGSRAFALGAQNTHHEKLGSHTGEISLSMLKNANVQYVIVGHSERRAEGETDAQIHTKLLSTVKAGFTTVLCVGEKARDEHAHYLTDIERQIRSALADLPRTKLGMVVIAYEPVWAIGSGKTATPEDVHEMRLFIEKVLSDIYGRNYAAKVRVLYGGSVNGKNARELFTHGTVDGFLVGGASLHAEDFAQIVKSVRSI
jgi:triosephosphate isomerase